MTPEEEARKARGKEIHRRVMIVLGAIIAASGLAAWHVGRGGAAFLEPALLGSWVSRRQAPPPLVHRPIEPLVRWSPWTPEALARARGEGKLVLLWLVAEWSRPCRRMSEAAFASPETASFAASAVVAVSADADARPDLALRYLGKGWPTTALLLPSGEVVESGTYMDGPTFLSWAKAVTGGYVRKREAVARALASAKRPEAALSGPDEPGRVLEKARGELGAWWTFSRLRPGFGLRLSPPPAAAAFPRFDALQTLLSGVDEPWAVELATRALSRAMRVEDPAWGGFYRHARGEDWSEPEHEKLLADQAAAVGVLARLSRVPEARRTLAYVERFLEDPKGGYRSSQLGAALNADGEIVEGELYFAKPDAARRALGRAVVDGRLFAGSNGAMAAAVLDAGSVARPRDRAFALKTLERWWRAAVKKGRVAHELGQPGPTGLLEDQLALADAYLAAYAATKRTEQRERAAALLGFCEAALLDEASGALLDRPATGELSPALDQLPVPALEYRAWRVYRRLAAALPAGSPLRARADGRAGALRRWLWDRRSALDAASLAVLASAGL